METNKSISDLRHLLDEDMTRLFATEYALKHRLTAWLKDNHYISLTVVLQNYLAITERHAEQLSAFLEVEQAPPALPVSRILQAFTEEIDEKLALCGCREIKEACLLAGIQAINHYKIFAYGTASAFAEALELTSAAGVFQHAEADEKDVDARLSHLAKHEVNQRAKAPILLSKM